MTTEVILTGTGVPHPTPGRAGAGTLVRTEHVAVQFDAGRATVLRMAEAGTHPARLDALFLTHVHSDHVHDVPDLTMTRWLHQKLETTGPLPIVAPDGPTARFVRRMLGAFEDDIAIRMAHADATPPQFDLTAFPVAAAPRPVWESTDGTVSVDAVEVHHEPVTGAVAYRVRTADGIVVISGDTVVCDEVAEMADDADVLVHEACRATALARQVAGTAMEAIFSYHADTVALGALAEKAGVGHLVLTHLIPPPADAASAALFEADVRRGGYRGRVTVGEDLTRIVLGSSQAMRLWRMPGTAWTAHDGDLPGVIQPAPVLESLRP
jgi:ribonuclease Z